MPRILSSCCETLGTCSNAIAALAFGLALCGASATEARAQVCGDVNGSNTVTSGDALSVLKFAVGQDVALTCSGDCAALDPRVTDLEDALASTQTSLAEVQDLLAETTEALADVQALLAGVSRTDTALVISGANLQVVDGSSATAGPVNGLGNVIIGYNERSFGQGRTGSHNLIVGEEHAYTSFGGIVGGERNTISNRAASVVGGKLNVASGLNSSVCGGSENSASGQFASVGGGFANASSGQNAAISGGCENAATNTYSAISGGQAGVASGFWSSVTGGFTNKATASHSAVSGGSTHTAASQYNWRAGSLSEAQ
jgi:hypothetical protein